MPFGKIQYSTTIVEKEILKKYAHGEVNAC